MIVEVVADIDVIPDDVLNSDSISDYKAQLDCDVDNASLTYLTNRLKKFDEIEIIASMPTDEGIDEYGELLNNYKQEYSRKSKKYEG